MKITIDDDIINKSQFSYQETLALLLIKSCDEPIKLIKSLYDKQYYVIEQDKYYLSNIILDKIQNIILDSEKIKIDGVEELAEKMIELYPKGKKNGCSQMWRSNKKDISTKLRKFFKIYGDQYSYEDIYNATKRYTESFNGNYQYMRILKYFIMKDEVRVGEDSIGYVERVSELANWIENGNDAVNTLNEEWNQTMI